MNFLNYLNLSEIMTLILKFYFFLFLIKIKYYIVLIFIILIKENLHFKIFINLYLNLYKNDIYSYLLLKYCK